MNLGAVLLVATAASGCAAAVASAPTIDGRVDPQEWRGTAWQTTAAGLRIRFRRQGDLLYLAVAGTARGYPTLFVAGPEQIEVLHASAALGRIAYHRGVEGWRTDAGAFDFAMRQDANGRQPPEGARREFFERQGWLSTSSRDHSSVREFMIRVRPGRMSVAVSFVEIPSGRITTWPDGLTDDTRDSALVLGNVPATARFDVDAWHRIDG